MEVIEDVDRRRLTLKVEDPERAYDELRDLLQSKMSFDHVHEDKYYNDVEEGIIRARLITDEHFDRFTKEELEIFLKINKQENEMDLQVKAKLATHYPEKFSYQTTIWYYGYRGLYDKFLYGSVRHGYEHPVEEKLETLITRVRDTLEA